MNWIEVSAAYGRTYKNQTEVRADWNGGKDFRTTSTGQYITKAEAAAHGLQVTVRYADGLKVVSV